MLLSRKRNLWRREKVIHLSLRQVCPSNPEHDLKRPCDVRPWVLVLRCSDVLPEIANIAFPSPLTAGYLGWAWWAFESSKIWSWHQVGYPALHTQYDILLRWKHFQSSSWFINEGRSPPFHYVTSQTTLESALSVQSSLLCSMVQMEQNPQVIYFPLAGSKQLERKDWAWFFYRGKK